VPTISLPDNPTREQLLDEARAAQHAVWASDAAATATVVRAHTAAARRPGAVSLPALDRRRPRGVGPPPADGSRECVSRAPGGAGCGDGGSSPRPQSPLLRALHADAARALGADHQLTAEVAAALARA
jgi:hypothetical protein